MDSAFIGAFLKGAGETGVFGLGWVAFLWAMMQLRYERTRYQHLVVHIIQYFTKVNMLRDIEGDSDSSERHPHPLQHFDGGIGRIFGAPGDDFSGLIPRRRRERSKRGSRSESQEDSK